MTAQTLILNGVKRAQQALKAGDCERAQQFTITTWGNFQHYLGSFSRSTQASLRKKVTKIYTQVAQACGPGEGLLPPSGQSLPASGYNPDALLPPSGQSIFHGGMNMLGDDGVNLSIPSAAKVINAVGLFLSLAVLTVGVVTVVKAAHKGSR